MIEVRAIVAVVIVCVLGALASIGVQRGTLSSWVVLLPSAGMALLWWRQVQRPENLLTANLTYDAAASLTWALTLALFDGQQFTPTRWAAAILCLCGMLGLHLAR